MACVGATALTLSCCHPSEPPPLPPPKPTNPNSLGVASVPAEVVLDASLVVDGGHPWDAGFVGQSQILARTP
jgi:hypothetical protein